MTNLATKLNLKGGIEGLPGTEVGGEIEKIISRDDFSLDDAMKVLDGKVIAFIGYGKQGPGQSKNMRDNIKKYNSDARVIIGQRKGTGSWDKAIAHGWVEGVDLFPVEEAAEMGDIVSFLVSDAGQKEAWPEVKAGLKPGDTLCVSHGFPMHFKDQTKIVPSNENNVILVAPKGAGDSVRINYKNGSGINSSFAIDNDIGNGLEICLAMGMAIGSGYLFDTTFENEVVSDLVGERAVLLGEAWALAEAAYKQQVDKGEDSKTAFINSSEQLTQVILPLIGAEGIEGIYKRAEFAGGDAMATLVKYENMVYEAVNPVFDDLYNSVTSGKEAEEALDLNSREGYRDNLDAKLDEIIGSEMWLTGSEVRAEDSDEFGRHYNLEVENWALAGAAIGMLKQQFYGFIERGHSPSEAFNETFEELTESLNQFYQDNGAAHLLDVCSTTAQTGALKWGPIFGEKLDEIFLGNPRVITGGNDTQLGYKTSKFIDEVGAQVRSYRPQNTVEEKETA